MLIYYNKKDRKAKNRIKRGEKLEKKSKSEKRAKNLQKRLAKWPGVWYYT